MRNILCLVVWLTVCVLGCLAGPAEAIGACALCGHHGPCNKVCRLKCEDKKVEVICWGLKRENFCVNGCSKRCEKHCEIICEECNHVDPYEQASFGPKKFVWSDWIPRHCAKMYTKNKLVKKTVTKKIPTYKWVVEDLCPHCELKTNNTEVTPVSTVPPPQATALPTLPQQPGGVIAYPQAVSR